ncbi:MAG: FecR family protein [Saprospiraceae bacterium]|nr:FecR family protein [Saprospiraceae bacterium]MBK6665021.1 FecR family protein [Saprospiraceae bacterium]MBK9581981.1 FecR family protein [Saprospiraceae bacterium]
MDIKNNKIDDLITKYLCGEATPDEAIQLEEWKDISKENQSYFDNMQETFLIVSDKEWTRPDKENAWLKFHNNTKSTRKVFWLYRIAAVFVVGILAAIFFINNDKIPTELIADDAVVSRSLPDQSGVTLQPGSSLTFDEGFGKNNRKLKLSGKARFTVKHNEELPFIIESNGVFIEDLGTVFTVESLPQSDTIHVVVDEGIVRLYDENGTEIIIKAGEKAWYIRSQKTIISDINTKVLKFDFKDTRLAEVIDLLEDTYQIEVKLSPQSIGECTITTQFFDEDVATIITIISETLDFKYEYLDHHYIIKGRPCQ